MTVPAWMRDDPRLLHVHHRPACDGVRAEWPQWVSAELREAAARHGVERPWTHQVAAAEAAFGGSHVALATPTASGKTLAYLLPVIAAATEGRLGYPMPSNPRRLLTPQHTAIYLAPTKALAHDQWRAAREFGLPGFRVSTLDGDSEAPERRFARDFASYVLTNPDMLHRAVLPNHTRFTRLLGNLRFVVVDEAHRYRGVFGAQVAAVLRRLRRLAHHYGADPVFISSSATMAEAGGHLTALAGVEPVVTVDADGSRRPALDFCLWQPTEDAHTEAAELMGRLIGDGRQTLTFTSSRVQAELVALRAQKLVTDPSSVASYRAGYLPGERRALERSLTEGRLRGVASTDALELGVDISGMDAVVSCGFPGTLASLWQRAGRAGRAGRDALAVLVAKPEPLDTYLCSHAELIFDQPVERTVLHPQLPAVLAPHLAAAAQELPLTEADCVWFGATTVALAEQLTADGVLRRRPNGWFWTRSERAVDAIDLRSTAGGCVDIVDAATGRVIGQVDPHAADRTVHPGAVYLHQGEQWLVTESDPEGRSALVKASTDPFFTQAVGDSELRVLADERRLRLPGAVAHLGGVELTSQVTGYLRRDAVTGKVWDSTPLESPVRHLRTRAVWWTMDEGAVAASGIRPQSLPGAAHAAEHAAIGLLPAFAPCDRWDLGGLSTVLHPDTGRLTVFVHEGQPGGAGFSEHAFEAILDWLAATLEQLRTCPCEAGCPRCTVSPKCGNGNHPLDKPAAVALLATALTGTPTGRRTAPTDRTPSGCTPLAGNPRTPAIRRA